jgi:hypothetical protein
MSSHTLELLPWRLAVCRLVPDAPLPAWAEGGPFLACVRTPDELSVICEQVRVPDSIQAERDFRALRVAGTLDFALVGILAALLGPLAAAGVSVFTLSTFDTDYVLVREQALDNALAALKGAGHQIRPVEHR